MYPGFQNRGDAISSFYLQLLVNEKDYMIAGWPESVYSQDNILSYGHGYGMDASSIGILYGGELQVYTFDDPTHLTDQNIEVKAKLTINDEDSFVFEITEFPHRR
jgi:hypothetical protein